MRAALASLPAFGLAFLLLVLFAWQPIAWQQAGLPWMTLVVTFVLIPLADHCVGAPRQGVPRAQTPWARRLPRVHLPLQAVLIGWACTVAPSLAPLDVLALGLAVGTVTGGLGITLAHELGHRASRLDRAIARLLLWMVGYGHFQVEHIRGHHVRVATDADPASAPRGMAVYRFVARSLWGSWRHAWALEAMRLAHQGQPAWHWRNEVLASNLLSLMLLVAITLAFGPAAGALWLLQAAWAVFLLESVNYIEHYGLRRAALPPTHAAGFERVRPEHSWNADFALSNALLFNLQRHSDHHAQMNKPWETLATHDEAPQMPAGYPAMLPLAWVPPLWHAVMDARLDRWQRSRPASVS